MKGENSNKSISILLYAILVIPFSIGLFLHGFFPLTNYNTSIATVDDIPQFIENVRLKTETLYQPMVKKLIVLIIDALRWDFIAGPIGSNAMPGTTTLIANSSACLLQAKVQSPTVTMPRIKAITTGTVPGFIDVALNFGSKPAAIDNILLQAKHQDHKLVFYGDDTWLKLFPDTFHEYEGTTSFVVTDFTEVDNNVSRHINNKLHIDKNWSVMVLHYLGLDHIGHVHGPFSPLISTKLQEMDSVIMNIQSKIQEWNQNDEPSLFIICGDHGMKDSGGHGGSTMAETTVPFVAIGAKCLQKSNEPKKIAQIDITPTLSHLLGIPIPLSNIGSTFLSSLYELPASQKLFILFYNAKQVMTQFDKIPNYQLENSYHKYIEAVKLHVAWLNTKAPTNDLTDDIVIAYETALKGMQEVLISRMIKYDYNNISIAMLFMCQIFCIMMGQQLGTKRNLIRIAIANVLSGIVLIGASKFFDFDSALLPKSSDSAVTNLLKIVILVVLICNCYLIARTTCSRIFSFQDIPMSKLILIFATLVHSISLGGSSFVEEEHQTWYFYFATLLTVLFCNSIKYFCENLRSNCKQSQYAQTSIKLLLILIGHRVVRKLNSTGDKYAYLPDIAGWLKDKQNISYMTLSLLTALVLLIWIDYKSQVKKHRYLFLTLNIALGMCIYCRHMFHNTVLSMAISSYKGTAYEIQIFWYLFAIFILGNSYHLMQTWQNKPQTFLRNAILILLKTWVIVSALVHQPYNVILLPLQIMFSSTIRTLIRHHKLHEIGILIFTWIGNTFYFYQGNSNSLATIDVAAGYVGIQTYVPVFNGLFMLINTYSAIVLAYLLLMYYIALEYQNHAPESILKSARAYLVWRLLPTVIYMIIITIQRHHLFVWTVFSPKLLYESVHTTVLCIVSLMLLVFVMLHDKINKYR